MPPNGMQNFQFFFSFFLGGDPANPPTRGRTPPLSYSPPSSAPASLVSALFSTWGKHWYPAGNGRWESVHSGSTSPFGAFDTMDHSLFIQHLQNEVGLTGTALSWFRSYLENRCQRVIIHGKACSEQQLCFGMLQGSVLGPQLFTLYMTPLGRIIRKHGLYHFYADDSQLHIFVKPVQLLVDIAASRMQHCIEDIHNWMRANFLKCNGNKIEILLIGSQRQTASISLDGITIDNAVISPSAAARNPGVIFDSKMSLVTQVGAVCKSVRYDLHIIGRIRRCLTRQTCKLLVHALVTSRMDMYNGLLIGLPRCLTNRI